MYKIFSVKIFSVTDRFAVKRAHPFLSLFYLSLFLFACSLAACATRRTVTTTQVVTDTTRVTVTDTCTLTQWRDSIRFHDREVIRERIVTRYSPDTGQPIEQTIQRDVTRLRDSIVLHLRDSLRSVLQFEAQHARADSLSHITQQATGSATQGGLVYALKWIVLYVIIIGFIFATFKILINIHKL